MISVEPMDDCVAQERYILTAELPVVLKVPDGSWFCIEQYNGAEELTFSDCAVGEYENDDFRRSI